MPSKFPDQTSEQSSDPNSARSIAFAALERVLFKADFAAAALDDELGRRSGVKPQDRGLATELTYGVLRTKVWLEQELGKLAPRGIGRDPIVLLRLLIAAYEIAFLDRVPNFASVNEAVSAVRAARGPSVAGFCNAVLRRFTTLPRIALAEATLQSAPEWLRASVTQAVGEREAAFLFGPNTEASKTPATDSTEPSDAEATPLRVLSGGTLRFRAGAEIPEWAHAAARGLLYPGAYRFAAMGDLRRHPEFERGQFVIQDEGSMFGAHALGTRPGERVLDACAGRGHKASLLADELSPGGQLWVTDTGQQKLNQLLSEFARLQLPTPEVRRVDWTKGDDTLPRDFDRVLVDAPCTGSGTLRRRPEIALRLVPEDVERLATLAEHILRKAAAHCKPGGHVLFVVCSVLRRETLDVVERVSDVLESVPFDCTHPLLTPATTSIHLLPGTHGCDGFFLASLRPKQAC